MVDRKVNRVENESPFPRTDGGALEYFNLLEVPARGDVLRHGDEWHVYARKMYADAIARGVPQLDAEDRVDLYLRQIRPGLEQARNTVYQWLRGLIAEPMWSVPESVLLATYELADDLLALTTGGGQ